MESNSTDLNIELSNHWENCHTEVEKKHHFFLTGSILNSYLHLFNCQKHYIASNKILEIGIGEGQAVKEMAQHKKTITTCDISKSAEDKIKDVASYYHLNDIDKIPKNNFDIIFCHLVVQHVDDNMLENHLKHLISTLNDKGVYYIQYRGIPEERINELSSIDELCKYGDVTRDPTCFKNIVEKYNGVVIEDKLVISGDFIGERKYPWCWRVIKIMKNKLIV